MDNQLSKKAILTYERHNDGSIANVICKCEFCKYVRHIRQPWYPCPFKGCPSCRPDLNWKLPELPNVWLDQNPGKGPEGWKYNCLYGLTVDERECLKGTKFECKEEDGEERI